MGGHPVYSEAGRGAAEACGEEDGGLRPSANGACGFQRCQEVSSQTGGGNLLEGVAVQDGLDPNQEIDHRALDSQDFRARLLPSTEKAIF